MPEAQHINERRKSIAKLTRSPLLNSPIVSGSPQRFMNNSYGSNGPFLKRNDYINDDDAVDSQSSTRDGSQERLPRLGPEDQGEPNEELEDQIKIQLSKHLPSNNAPLQQEGGDITRELYNMSVDKRSLRRSRSMSDTYSRRGSTASSLNVPGGFRRQFVRNRYKTVPSRWTRDFIEFLSIYGHFAGEELEDEEDIACHYVVNEEELSLRGRSAGTASNSKAYFLLLKAFVGTGVLFLPKAFANGGLSFSVLVLVFFGALSYWCYVILVYSKVTTGVQSFAEIGKTLYGTWLQQLILISIVVSQLGFVAAYLVFTAESLQNFFFNALGLDHTVLWYIVVEVIILFPLSLVRDITRLSLLALLANVFILCGILTISFYIMIQLLAQQSIGENVNLYFNKSDFSLFIGTAIFAFEGIGLILPVQESMKRPQDFPKVLLLVIITISVIFIGIGSFGYLTYGDKTKTAIILNLPANSIFVNLVQFLYSVAILLSAPIQLFPAIRLVESKVFNRNGKYSVRVKWMKNLFRLLFVLFTATIAVLGGQNLDRFVSFVGCFACIPLVYMYPPILHLKSCCKEDIRFSKSENLKRFWLGILDYFLVILGGCAMIYTTYSILVSG